MKLIPVIDLKGGAVVAAKMGRRNDYAPLATPLCGTSQPGTVAAALLKLYPFDTLYIADLDAIAGVGDHLDLLQALRLRHPEVTLWVDNGLTDLDRLHLFTRPVIGTEVLESLDQLLDLKARLERPVLSLDFRGDGLVGPAELRREPWLWPDDLIVMSISRVGSDLGPDITLLESLLRASPGKRVYAAGGVRHLVDLHRLRDLGAAGALVSTALHQGRIASAAIRALSAA